MSVCPTDARAAVWRALGASAEQADELLAYAANPIQSDALAPLSVALSEPPSVAAWEGYARKAEVAGAETTLRRVFVQLRFPIEAGMSQDMAYQAATRRGELPADGARGALFARPGELRIELHATPAGRVPVLFAGAREDFELLVRAITRRNEPDAVPPTMGACMIAGYNNWARVRDLRREYLETHPEDPTGAGWGAAFREIVPHKERYQDRFMLLSAGAYSGTPAAAVGLSPEEWDTASLRLRLEHECTHYFMRQAFGVMRESLLDELVADYMGLVEALGSFRVDCFLLFMGLESFPPYRPGGRLENYRSTLSDGAFAILQPVVERAARRLAQIDPARTLGPFDVLSKARVITALTRVGLEGLASPRAETLLATALDEATRMIQPAPASEA